MVRRIDMTAEKWLEEKGIDTSQLIAYYMKDGIGTADIDIPKLMEEYSIQIAEKAVGEEKKEYKDSDHDDSFDFYRNTQIKTSLDSVLSRIKTLMKKLYT